MGVCRHCFAERRRRGRRGAAPAPRSGRRRVPRPRPLHDGRGEHATERSGRCPPSPPSGGCPQPGESRACASGSGPGSTAGPCRVPRRRGRATGGSRFLLQTRRAPLAQVPPLKSRASPTLEAREYWFDCKFVVAMSDIHIVILAAGKGTRMKSARPKVLHCVSGLPLIEHVLRVADSLEPRTTVVIVGHMADEVRSALQKRP